MPSLPVRDSLGVERGVHELLDRLEERGRLLLVRDVTALRDRHDLRTPHEGRGAARVLRRNDAEPDGRD